MMLSSISEFLRTRSVLSAEAKLTQITLTEVRIILISCHKPNASFITHFIIHSAKKNYQVRYAKTGENKQQLVNFTSIQYTMSEENLLC